MCFGHGIIWLGVLGLGIFSALLVMYFKFTVRICILEQRESSLWSNAERQEGDVLSPDHPASPAVSQDGDATGKKKQFTCVRSRAVPLNVTSDTQPGSKVSKQAFALYLVLAERGPKLQSLS